MRGLGLITILLAFVVPSVEAGEETTAVRAAVAAAPTAAGGRASEPPPEEEEEEEAAAASFSAACRMTRCAASGSKSSIDLECVMWCRMASILALMARMPNVKSQPVTSKKWNEESAGDEQEDDLY